MQPLDDLPLVKLFDVAYHSDFEMWVRGQLNVIQNSNINIQKLRYGFLYAFYSKYDAILYCLRDIATYWSKTAKFLYPTRRGDPVKILPICLILIKLE